MYEGYGVEIEKGKKGGKREYVIWIEKEWEGVGLRKEEVRGVMGGGGMGEMM